jgi:hypothetical protein
LVICATGSQMLNRDCLELAVRRPRTGT